MAAKRKAAKKKAEKRVIEYGLDYLAKALDLQPATIRQRLRALKVKRQGRSYDFGTKASADKAVKQLSAVGQG